jgi:hypothetical protein
MSDGFKVLLFSPGTIIGLIAGFLITLLFSARRWKPSVGLWLLAVILNAPTCIALHDILVENGKGGSGYTFVAVLLIYFWGTAGLGVALLLWLVRGVFARRSG